MELTHAGLDCQKQKPISVYYNDHLVGSYYADLIVEQSLILELKASEVIIKEYEYQLINYLRATEVEVGLLLNFGKKPEFRRKTFTYDRKSMSKEHR